MRWILLCLMLTGCQHWSTTNATSVNEEFILAETDRLAAQLGKKVHGELTDKVYNVGPDSLGRPQIAAGWYNAGVAYYYRPVVNREDFPYLTSLAAHEVCHAKEWFHGPAHDACVLSLGG